MKALQNKHILLGISGGIAAYKSPDLVRRLREHGAEVRVVMTAGAAEFITPLTMQAVSGQPVHQYLLDPEAESGMGHIELARWADVVLIAPTTANLMARLAHGLADDLLTTVCLATEADIAIAPAMNQQMWANSYTQRNLDSLRDLGVKIFGPGEGDQACGETGPGRMLEPNELVDLTADLFAEPILAGKNVLITAGPTQEALDPVRVLTNHSSGKMGYAIAQAAVEAGANVTLVSGPTTLAKPPKVNRVDVLSAIDMEAAVQQRIHEQEVFIAVAAVADYRPAHAAEQKIKKHTDGMTIELVKNPDILAGVGQMNTPPFIVGFAAETENVIENARKKLHAKGADLIAANHVGISGSGFGSEQNSLVLIGKNKEIDLGAGSKSQLARKLIEHIAQQLKP